MAERRPRTLVVAAGASAALGCLGLAVATSAEWFVVSAFVGGSGAGLASPALVSLLDTALPARWASSGQAVVNAGTSVGVAATGAVAAAATGPGATWPVMAVACLGAGAAVVVLAGRPCAAPSSRGARAPLGVAPVVVPTLAALLAGALSAAVWTFGPTAALEAGTLSPDQVGLLWIALGAGGLAGGFVDRLVARGGPGRAFAAGTGLLSLTTLLVLAPVGGAAWSLLGAAGFGAGYMALSGTLILWGRLLDQQRGPALTAWLFVALAVGQAGGSLAWGPVLA